MGELNMYIDKPVRLITKNGEVFDGLGWEIIYGYDKADDSSDYGIDSLVIKIGEDCWCEYVPGFGDKIESINTME